MPLPETYPRGQLDGLECCKVFKDETNKQWVRPPAAPETPPRFLIQEAPQSAPVPPCQLSFVDSLARPLISVKLEDITVKNGADEAFADLSTWISQQLESERLALVTQVKAELIHQLPQHSAACFNDMKEVVTAKAKTNGGQCGYQAEGFQTANDRVPLSMDVMDVTATTSTKSKRSNKGSQSQRDSMPRFNSDGRVIPKAFRPSAEIRANRLFAGGDTGMLESRSRLARYVLSGRFEFVSVSLIMLNTLVMALEIQYSGAKVGHDLDFPGFGRNPRDEIPYAQTTFIVLSVVFNGVFVIELCLRLIVGRKMALYSAWIWLDVFLVSFGVIDAATMLKIFDGIGFNPSMLRVARLARLMRLIKTLKGGRSNFHSLFLLMKSIQASFTALFWSILLLLAIMLSAGMIINQFMVGFFEDDDNSEDARRKVFDYFGTFSKTMLTMFELTLGNWAPAGRVLQEHVGEFWLAFIVIYRNVFCFAVINVIRAVFIMETTRVASSDDEVALLNKERSNLSLDRKLQGLFALIDSSGNGEISRAELVQAVTKESVTKYIGMLDLDKHSLVNLYDLMSQQNYEEGKGDSVEIHDFKETIASMRGASKSLDLWFVIRLIREVHDLLFSRYHVHGQRKNLGDKSFPGQKMKIERLTENDTLGRLAS